MDRRDQSGLSEAIAPRRCGQPAAGERGTTLGVRFLAAALLTARPASVPSSDSPNRVAGMAPGAAVAAGALAAASAAGVAVTGVAVADHV
ncbi:hypothetical protein MOTT27_04993 [Mycobacterium intracellulare subsp. yongonense]|nr:hypothetical protein MOTT27_04993 [Mycobacterium intracellulare subsp. yongonense]